ncbi:MAG: hypothetical protein ACMUHX_05490, partial [bacterium]
MLDHKKTKIIISLIVGFFSPIIIGPTCVFLYMFLNENPLYFWAAFLTPIVCPWILIYSFILAGPPALIY